MYIYIYIYTYVYIYIYIYIYVYVFMSTASSGCLGRGAARVGRKKGSVGDRGRAKDRNNCICIYTIYIYIYIYRNRLRWWSVKSLLPSPTDGIGTPDPDPGNLVNRCSRTRSLHFSPEDGLEGEMLSLVGPDAALRKRGNTMI